MNAIREQELNESFAKAGVLVLPGAAQTFVEAIQSLFDEKLGVREGQFNYSLMNLDASENLSLHEDLCSILSPLFEDLFEDYTIYNASYLIKPKGFSEEMKLHQDWTFTDEQQYEPITLWIPLMDVDEHSGALFAMPGSHRLVPNYRSLDYPTARVKREGELATYVAKYPINRGDVLLFNPSAFHGSFGNSSGKHRIVATATILPKAAPFIHVKQLDETTASIKHLSAGVFFSDLQRLGEPGTFEGSNSTMVDYEHKIYTEIELLNLMEKSEMQPNKS